MMGGKGSKEREQLSQLERNYYMGVQTTPESRLHRNTTDSNTGTAEFSQPTLTTSSVNFIPSAFATSASSRPTTTSPVCPTSSFVPRQVQRRPSATPASTRPTTTTPTVGHTDTASATTASSRPTTTTKVIRSTTTTPSSTTSIVTAKSAVAAAKWRPVGCTPASDDEEEVEEQVCNDLGTPRKVLTARRATATQPTAPSSILPECRPAEAQSNPFALNLAQTSYDDPYGYIAEAVRRTAEEVRKREEAALRPTPYPRMIVSTPSQPAAAAAPFLPAKDSTMAPTAPTAPAPRKKAVLAIVDPSTPRTIPSELPTASTSLPAASIPAGACGNSVSAASTAPASATGERRRPTDIEQALSLMSVEERRLGAPTAPTAPAPRRNAVLAIVNPSSTIPPEPTAIAPSLSQPTATACAAEQMFTAEKQELEESFELHRPKSRSSRTRAKTESTPTPRMVNGENLAVYNIAEIMKANKAAAEAEDAAEEAYLAKLRRINSSATDQSTPRASGSTTTTRDCDTDKKYYPFDSVLTRAEWEKQWREMDEERSRSGPRRPVAYMDRDGYVAFGPDIERPFPMLATDARYKATLAPHSGAFQSGSTPWENNSSDEELEEQLSSRPGTRHVAAASRQITRVSAAAAPAISRRPSVPTPSTSTGYQWPADIDEALARLSLADASSSGISSQRKAPVAAIRINPPIPAAVPTPKMTTVTAVAAAVAATRPPMVAEAIESVKSAGGWMALLRRHAELKEAQRRAMSDSRTTVAAPAAAAAAAAAAASNQLHPEAPAPPAANPSWRFLNDETHDAPRVAAPRAIASASTSAAAPDPYSSHAPYRFACDDDPVEEDQYTSSAGWKPLPAAPKATAVVSASSAAREFAAAASPRPVFQASSSDSSSSEDEQGVVYDYDSVAPYASAGDGRTELMDRFNRAMNDNPSLIKKLESMRSLSNLTLASLCEADTPLYTLSVGHKHICVFEPGREKIIRKRREVLEISDIEEGQIYRTTYITKDGLGDFFLPTDRYRDQLTERPSFIYGTPEIYRQLIIPALLLGSRVRDFEQRCATVIQLGDLVLNMPAQNNKRMKGTKLKLRTVSGIIFEVRVKNVIACDADKRWVVECDAPEQPLPRKVRQGALLEIMGGYDVQPRVTGALMNYYAGSRFNFRTKSGKQKRDRPSDIGHWELLECIYGPHLDRYFPPVVNSVNPMIHLAKNGGVVQLNPQQAEAVARYNCPVCPAFVVESPPGSGKTMTAAAMAVSYTGDGVQLFLSTANVPVINMALALAKLDYGSLKDLMTEETRSPFSVLSLAKANETMNEQIIALEAQLAYAPNDEEKDKIKAAIVKACGPVFADKYDIYFATVDMILGRLIKNNQNGKHKPDTIKKQLASSVRRIVVDEASQLTEAALNALILSFPDAQMVLIGDSKQLPPFRYSPRDVVSKLAARPALSVIKDKMNLPVITLSRVYRASPSMMAHYSECFYEGGLESFKPESVKSLLSCFGSRSKGSKCLFWKVDKGVAKKWGTSKFNFAEITSLRYIVNILRTSGYSEKEVMIISYYEAQRKKAEEELKDVGDYELLTVDSAQGREKKIVIVLTTRTSVPVQNDSVEAGEFFTCALRCNVAVSRHQEALIVLGHPSIASAPNWARVLSPKYFRHVEDTRSWKGGWVRND